MPDGNAEQTRAIADTVGKAAAAEAVRQFAAMHPELSQHKAEIPAPLKWAAAIISGLLLLASGGMATWLVTTVNEMQLTLARMDERMQGQDSAQNTRDDEQDRRIRQLEDRGVTQ